MHYISNILLKLSEHIENDPWRGLPELTNASELLSTYQVHLANHFRRRILLRLLYHPSLERKYHSRRLGGDAQDKQGKGIDRLDWNFK